MQGLMNALAPVDTAAARHRGTQNALAEMKARGTARGMNRNEAIRQTGQQTAQGGYSTEEHANALRKMGYTDAANKLVQQGQQTRSNELGNVDKGYEIVARTAPLARDQQSYDRIKRFWEEKGLAQAGELPDQFDPEVVRTLAGKAREKLSASDLVEVQGPDGRPRFVPADMATGMQPAQEQPDTGVNAQFQAVNKDTGERETLLRTDRGIVRQTVGEDGQARFEPVDSSRYRPVDTQETGTSGELSGLGDTEQRKLRDQQTSAQNFIATTGDAIKLLQENPNINTWSARAQSTLNSMAQEVKALGLGGANLKDSDKDPLNPAQWQDEFGEMGIQSDRLRGIIQSLAFSLARSREGGRLSESDIRSALKTVGTSADPQSLSTTMQDVANRVARRFRINYETRTGKRFEGSLGLESLPNYQPPQGEQQGPTREGAPEQSGGVEVDDETRRLIEQYGGQ